MKKKKRGTKLKFGVKTMVSGIRHPVNKKKYVKECLKKISDDLEKEYKKSDKE